jgi:hypothetical protein
MANVEYEHDANEQRQTQQEAHNESHDSASVAGARRPVGLLRGGYEVAAVKRRKRAGDVDCSVRVRHNVLEARRNLCTPVTHMDSCRGGVPHHSRRVLRCGCGDGGIRRDNKLENGADAQKRTVQCTVGNHRVCERNRQKSRALVSRCLGEAAQAYRGIPPR